MITEYHFVKYYPEFMKHIKRHFPGSGITGSVFTGRFRNPRQVIDFAYDAISSLYEGRQLIKIAKLDEIIGLSAVVPLLSIPKHVTVRRETRIKKRDAGRSPSYTVLVAYGMKRIPTRQMVIIAEPLPERKIHTFSTIHPGTYAPDFTDTDFWKNHVFINERKR
ncbi:MAG: hypothetical protein AABW80_00950 [Nanoarchaeota archaeon]